jgi:uncharacterized protein YegL
MQSFVQIVALHFKLSKGKHIMMITPKKEIQNVRIVFILDKSGSMNYIKNKTVSGFNEYIEQQKAEEGDAFVTLVQFDGKVSNSYTDVRIQDVPELQFYPNGNTALYDAVGSTVASMLSQPDRFDKTIIVIMTDGEENSSREYQHSTVMSLLNEAQNDRNWEVIFVGANIDAVKTANSLGIKSGKSVTFDYDSSGADSVMKSLSVATSSMRGKSFAYASGEAFCDASLDMTKLYSNIKSGQDVKEV